MLSDSGTDAPQEPDSADVVVVTAVDVIAANALSLREINTEEQIFLQCQQCQMVLHTMGTVLKVSVSLLGVVEGLSRVEYSLV